MLNLFSSVVLGNFVLGFLGFPFAGERSPGSCVMVCWLFWLWLWAGEWKDKQQNCWKKNTSDFKNRVLILFPLIWGYLFNWSFWLILAFPYGIYYIFSGFWPEKCLLELKQTLVGSSLSCLVVRAWCVPLSHCCTVCQQKTAVNFFSSFRKLSA